MTTALRITNAHKRFGTTPALDGAELTLERGQLLLLLGPNGAGKTTLVRAVAGRVRLDQGEIELLGQKLNGTNSARRSLGLVPQEVALYDLLTARENLEVFGRFYGLAGPELADRVKWALDWTGLADRVREPIKGFSGGMKRRLNIACGVLHRPEVILLDEPTVGVDPQSRERIWEMLDRLKHAGASLVLTTHQLDEAQARGDRIVIIDHGKTIAAGTFAELVERTVGTSRQITLTLDRPPPKPLDGLVSGSESKTVRIQAADVAAELPPLLERVRAAGCRVEDVAVQSPTLQLVFLHLTGRELRE
jgi:linearmycin/streptolysin S transport system ATP-binding protein